MHELVQLLNCSEFRGLWHSRTIFPDGHIEDGWSVTFVRDSNYCEIPYQSTYQGAVRMALAHLDKL